MADVTDTIFQFFLAFHNSGFPDAKLCSVPPKTLRYALIDFKPASQQRQIFIPTLFEITKLATIYVFCNACDAGYVSRAAPTASKILSKSSAVPFPNAGQ